MPQVPLYLPHLVHNARARRHHQHVLERLGAPLEETEALAVAVELELHVLLQGVGGASHIHLHRVVNDQVDRDLQGGQAWYGDGTN